jgi:Cyclin, N-terminal domain
VALLTSLTTLHLAIKLHDSKKIKINTLANLSRGQFGPKHIEDMEWKVLAALKWKLHPPTQYAFVSHLLLFLPSEASHAVRKELFELSRYLTELAVCDSFFVAVNNSTVAFASILNVMEDMSYTRLSAGIREKFLRELMLRIGMNHRSDSVVAARDRLKTMFAATSGQLEGDVAAVVPPQQQQHGRIQDNSGDSNSLAGSLSSAGSAGSSRYNSRPRSNSTDSKGSCRYSPSPRRRCVVANLSPMTLSRARLSSSPMEAGVQ